MKLPISFLNQLEVRKQGDLAKLLMIIIVVSSYMFDILKAEWGEGEPK